KNEPAWAERTGSPKSNAPYATRAPQASVEAVGQVPGTGGALVPPRYTSHPTNAPTAITHTCTNAPGITSNVAAEASAIDVRLRSGHSFLPIAHTAWITTAAAASLMPCNQPARLTSTLATPYAKPIISNAEAMVKQNDAATAPQTPARCNPKANATCLLAGPGKTTPTPTNSV